MALNSGVLINLLVLDYYLIQTQSVLKKQNDVLKRIVFSSVGQDANLNVSSQVSKIGESASSSNSQVKLISQDYCSQSCITMIKSATSSSTPKVGSEIKLQTQAVKEFYVPFGSGSNSSETWTDVSGVQAYIDTSQYGSIKQVIFEASIHIPTGNEIAWARLYNVTDKHPVWNSDVTISGGTAQLLYSPPIQLDSGNKLYQVQMKTQLKYPALLDQARVHITVN